jgi:hypothetical protein
MSLIQSNFGSGNFELIARMRDIQTSSEHLSFFYYESSIEKWHGPFDISVNGQRIGAVSGNPSFVQSKFGRLGNFELILPQNNSQLVHYSRNNDSTGYPWHKVDVLYDSAQIPGSPIPIRAAVIESNFGKGNLEVVARMHPKLGRDYLSFFYYERNTGKWHGPFDITVDGQQIEGITGF